MIEVERVELRLPHFLRDDAGVIASAVVHALADLEFQGDVRLSELALPPLVLARDTPPAVAARTISSHVVDALRGVTG